jgi:hypothetical protein
MTRAWDGPEAGDQASCSTSTSASSWRHASTRSKGRPNPSTPPWTLKLATVTPSMKRQATGAGPGHRRIMGPARSGSQCPGRSMVAARCRYLM